MSYRVTKNEHVIDLDTRSLISVRYKRITKAVNQTFWNSISDTDHMEEEQQSIQVIWMC